MLVPFFHLTGSSLLLVIIVKSHFYESIIQTINLSLYNSDCCSGSNGFTVYLGSLNVLGVGGQEINVRRTGIYQHPAWNPVGIANDICLLRLDSPAILSTILIF